MHCAGIFRYICELRHHCSFCGSAASSQHPYFWCIAFC